MIESHFSPGFPARKIEVFLSVRNLIHTQFSSLIIVFVVSVGLCDI